MEVNELTQQEYFTCIGRGHGAPCLPATRREWEALRREPWLSEMCQRIENGQEELKHRLPVWTPSCAEFKDHHRAAADALKPLNRLMMDFDEKGHTEEILQKLKSGSAEELKSEELRVAGMVVLLVEESVRRGTHVLVELPAGMDAATAQQLMKEATGFEPDKQVKGIERCIYMVPESHTRYVSDSLFTCPDTCPRGRELGSEGPHGIANAAERTEHPAERTENPAERTRFKGILYSDIISEWFRRTGGEPQQGERNDRLHRLAAHLRYITDNNEQMLLEIMPRYGLSEDEMRGLIHSACQGRFFSMPKLMQQVVGSLTPKDETAATETGLGEAPPEMPRKLPPLIKLLLQNTPDIYRPAVAHAVFPSLGAHLHKTRFRYIDNVEHEATLMNCLMAGTGAGKDCISEPINRIMADIRRRDAENLEREKAWKKQVNSKGANKDKAERPEGLIIQEIDADVTNAAFVQRMAEADEHFLYVKMNEIDQFDALKGNGRGNHQFQIMCLSFDPGNRYGQTRVGTQSVTEKVCIRFNWNAATTIKKGLRYFQNVLTDGPVSRINFCTIPRREIGADMPVYGTYDAAFDELLRPYIERLTSARGTIDCPQAFRLAQKLKNECAEFARVSQSETYWNLSFRANVIAYLKACVLFVAHGYQWTKEMEQFVRWSLKYDLWCKMRFFGDAIEQAEQGTSPSNRRGPRNLLELLPNEFTFGDAVSVRSQQGLSREGTQDMIRAWRNRGYIEELNPDDNRTNSSNSFSKLKYRN